MISIIAAIGKNQELGKNNKLLWHIGADMRRFKELTTGNAVIMGRKTYDSLPNKFRPLPNRINIIVTRNNHYKPPGSEVYHSVEDAIKNAKKYRKEIFIIGGASIYNQAIGFADKLYLTLVDREYPEADVYFPDYTEFKNKIKDEKHSDGKLKFRFIELAK